jgi:hypothetical protein
MHCRGTFGALLKTRAWGMAMIGLFAVGCGASPTSFIWGSTPFPPRHVMQTGDYTSFLAENQGKLDRCAGWTECDVALFNLSFIYAYPLSPYRNPRKARHYLAELQRQYTQSPWTSQGQVLMAFLDERAVFEETQRRLQAELRSREATIRKLLGQLDRSRDIDIEMEKKERELLR